MTRGRWFLIWIGSAIFAGIYWIAFAPSLEPAAPTERQRWRLYRKFGSDCCDGAALSRGAPVTCPEVLRALIDLAALPVDKSEFGASARSEMTKCPAARALAAATPPPVDADPARTYARQLTGSYFEQQDAARALLSDPQTTTALISRIKAHDYAICGEAPGCPAKDRWSDALATLAISAELGSEKRAIATKTAAELRR